VFRNETGDLYHEELFGTEGFAGKSSLLYHINPPTRVKDLGEPIDMTPKVAVQKNLKALSFKGLNLPQVDDYIESRKTLFFNSDCAISLAAPKKSFDYFFKNADADEMIFVHYGRGTMKTMFGEIPFENGDYIIIPRGVIYQMNFETENNRFLVLETFAPIDTPARYKNKVGQYLEHSPFCERDFKYPTNFKTYDEEGDFKVKIKKDNILHPYTYANHPFDLIGWDGCMYPYAMNIKDFEPLTGRIHMPPPIHQHFENVGLVVCSFVPRLYDYHPDAIPAPYHHSNIDSDELLYYVEGDFMSRNDISEGQITLHPGGIPHGPHPGAIERSIGKKATEEYAVMIDPFRPVQITEEAMNLEVPDYYKSWMVEPEMSY
jgi:homogentisate 1,2-dioxygenase